MSAPLSPMELVENVEGLPTLPSVIARVNQLVLDSNASAADISAIISNDLALSSRLLKLANSSYYGFPNKISSVTHAMVMLGFNTVRNVVLSCFVLDAFEARDLPFGYRRFWVHSIGTAVASSVLLRAGSRRQADDGFICGLLHDIGKVVLHQFARRQFAEVLGLVRRRNCLLVEAEREVLGFTHAEIGGALLSKWNLPPFLSAAVENHHAPKSPAEPALLSAAVHAADVMARALLIGNGGDKRIPRLLPEAGQALGITPSGAAAILEEILVEMKKTEGFLELI